MDLAHVTLTSAAPPFSAARTIRLIGLTLLPGYLIVLAVAVAFLIRFGLERGFVGSEIFGLAAAGALILIYPYVKTQVGLAAVLIVLALVAQRALTSFRGAGESPRARNP
jgi:hypothetical protein